MDKITQWVDVEPGFKLRLAYQVGFSEQKGTDTAAGAEVQ